MANVLAHIAGPSGAGKSTITKYLKQQHKSLASKDIDDFMFTAITKHGLDDIPSETYTDEQWKALDKTRQELLDAYIKKQKKPVVVTGHHDTFDGFLHIPTDNKLHINIEPEESAFRMHARLDRPSSRFTVAENADNIENAIGVQKTLDGLGYERKSMDEIKEHIAKHAAAIDIAAIPSNQFKLERQHLDFDTLHGTAFKITHPGGGPAHNPSVGPNQPDWDYSIVTPHNGDSWNWPEKPEAVAWIKKHDPDFLNGTQTHGPDKGKHNLNDQKYMQITTPFNKTAAEATTLLRPRSELYCFKDNTVLCAVRPNFLVFPGGGINENESQEAAAVRECEEEFGRTPTHITPIAKGPVTCLFKTGKYDGTITHLFTGEAPRNPVMPSTRHKDYESTASYRSIREVLDILATNATKHSNKPYLPLYVIQQQILGEYLKDYTKTKVAIGPTAVITGIGAGLGAAVGAWFREDDRGEGAITGGLGGAFIGYRVGDAYTNRKKVEKGWAADAAKAEADKAKAAKIRAAVEASKTASILYGAGIGGLIGMGAGAYLDEDNRLKGALIGGVGGAAVGGLAGFAYSEYNKPKTTATNKPNPASPTKQQELNTIKDQINVARAKGDTTEEAKHIQAYATKAEMTIDAVKSRMAIPHPRPNSTTNNPSPSVAVDKQKQRKDIETAITALKPSATTPDAIAKLDALLQQHSDISGINIKSTRERFGFPPIKRVEFKQSPATQNAVGQPAIPALNLTQTVDHVAAPDFQDITSKIHALKAGNKPVPQDMIKTQKDLAAKLRTARHFPDLDTGAIK